MDKRKLFLHNQKENPQADMDKRKAKNIRNDAHRRGPYTPDNANGGGKTRLDKKKKSYRSGNAGRYTGIPAHGLNLGT
jgi:hypothetical protein